MVVRKSKDCLMVELFSSQLLNDEVSLEKREKKSLCSIAAINTRNRVSPVAMPRAIRFGSFKPFLELNHLLE